MRRRWQPCLPLLIGNQDGKALKWLPAHFDFERIIRLLFRECVYKFGTFCSEVWQGTEVPYTPCLLMKTVLCLRLYAMQSQSCFPAVSNSLALPVGNGIFTATPTERITHYTLQAKSCAKGGTLWKPCFVVVSSHTSSKTQNKRLQSAVKNTAGLTAYFVVSIPIFSMRFTGIFLKICFARVEKKP